MPARLSIGKAAERAGQPRLPCHVTSENRETRSRGGRTSTAVRTCRRQAPRERRDRRSGARLPPCARLSRRPRHPVSRRDYIPGDNARAASTRRFCRDRFLSRRRQSMISSPRQTAATSASAGGRFFGWVIGGSAAVGARRRLADLDLGREHDDCGQRAGRRRRRGGRRRLDQGGARPAARGLVRVHDRLPDGARDQPGGGAPRRSRPRRLGRGGAGSVRCAADPRARQRPAAQLGGAGAAISGDGRSRTAGAVASDAAAYRRLDRDASSGRWRAAADRRSCS